MPEVLQLRRELRIRWRLVLVSTLVLYLAVIGVTFWAIRDANQKRDAIRKVAVSTNDALCTLRADLLTRVRASEDFLIKNPEGIPGIPTETIRTSITNQRHTIDALASLFCPEAR